MFQDCCCLSVKLNMMQYYRQVKHNYVANNDAFNFNMKLRIGHSHPVVKYAAAVSQL